MAINKEDILEALCIVMEPGQSKDLVSMGRIEDIQSEGNRVSFSVYLDSDDEKIANDLKQACIDAVKQVADTEIEVYPNMRQKGKNESGTEMRNEKPFEKIKNIIAVASGKGGVGKSTISVNLAVALAKTGAKTGLLDTDIYGPSIPTMFNIHQHPEITPDKKIIPLEKFGVKLLSIGFLVDPSDAVVWRGPMVSSAVRQFLSDAQWGDLDYLILDLPPGTGDIQLTIVQTVSLTGAVIVSTPQNVALDDARKGVSMFSRVDVPVLGIVENMAFFTPPDLPGRKYHIFGKDGAKNLAQELRVPFLGEIPIEERLREGGDSGTPIVTMDGESPSSLAFSELTKRIIHQTDVRNKTQPPTKKTETFR